MLNSFDVKRRWLRIIFNNNEEFPPKIIQGGAQKKESQTMTAVRK